MRYVGRLAPSPTGYLHLGHAATFLTAADRACAAGGDLLLRVDDLDPQRSKEQFIAAAKEDLTWLGLHWQAGYRQSQRMLLYRAAMESLVQRELAYPCACTRRDLQAAVQAPHEDTDDEPVYNGRCRPGSASFFCSASPSPENALPSSPLAPQKNYRFRCPEQQVVAFSDGNLGRQEFVAGRDFGDFVIWRKDGLPSYQLACVVDDAAMQITEVVRGRDLLKSTARQILLQQALGLATPAYFHTELLRDADGQRLAKRHDALSLRTLRGAGVTLPEIRARIASDAHHTEA